MAQSKYERVCSILRGESVGCMNVGSKNEFFSIASDIIGFGCFKSVVFNALINQLVEKIKEYRSWGLLDEDYAFDVFCEDKDYRVAFQLSGILFPSVLCYCTLDREKKLQTHDCVYAFRNLDGLDIDNIADMFIEEKRNTIHEQLSTCDTTEEATEMIISGMFIIPF